MDGTPFRLSSDSTVQRDAERQIVEALCSKLDLPPLAPRRIAVGDGLRIDVDGASADESVVVEAYARIGVLKGGQPKKIAQDILKLVTLKREPGRDGTRTIVAFASPEARRSIAGWVQHAAGLFGVELEVVQLPEPTERALLAAQSRQRMTNVAIDPHEDAPPIGQYGPTADYGEG